MESESSVATPSSLKLDTPNVFQAFHSFSSQPSLAPFNNNNSSYPYPSLHYQQGSSNDLFDSSKGMNMNTPRSLENPMQSLQSRMMENSKLANAPQDKISLTQSPSAMSSGAVPVNGPPGTPSAGHQSFAYDERFHALYEREIRWNEVRRYINLIRQVSTEAAHIELTKDAFYDLYNLALLLLKAVDSLDPDKNKKSESGQYFSSQMSGALTPSGGTMISTPMGMAAQAPLTDADLLAQQRKSYDLYGMRNNQGAGNAFDGATYLSSVPKYATLPTEQTLYAYSQGQEGNLGMGAYPQSMQMGGGAGGYPAHTGAAFMKGGSTPTAASSSSSSSSAAEQKNFTGEVFFDDVGQGADGNRPKRRRRRTVYSSRRNLHCHMCGVTETPEWRRGPAGDHTLCNACGLHYAKSLKKQRKERDTRKHSIDMLLNEQQQQPAIPSQNANSSTNNGTTGQSPNGNHSSPDSSHEDMTPPTELLSTN